MRSFLLLFTLWCFSAFAEDVLVHLDPNGGELTANTIVVNPGHRYGKMSNLYPSNNLANFSCLDGTLESNIITIKDDNSNSSVLSAKRFFTKPIESVIVPGADYTYVFEVLELSGTPMLATGNTEDGVSQLSEDRLTIDKVGTYFIAKKGRNISDLDNAYPDYLERAYLYCKAGEYYSIKFRVSLFSGSMVNAGNFSSYVAPGEGLKVGLPSPVKRGFEFIGWYNTEGSRIYDNTPVTNVEEHSLVAEWKWLRASNPEEFSEENLLATGLPLVVIDLIDGEEPSYDIVKAPEGCWGKGIANATKVPGRMTIKNSKKVLYDSGEYVKGESGITVKIRGNTSAIMSAKKPYKLKLQKKADLLNRKGSVNYKDKNWVLLASTDSLYNVVGFKVNEIVGQAWTPEYIFVNVVINGDYRGLYMLTESEERNQDCRIDIAKDGFLFECDAYWWNEPIHFKTDQMQYARGYTFKYPDEEDVTAEQISTISNAMQAVENSINDGSYSKHIDVDSWAGWLLGHDIMGTSDSGGSNIFLTKYDSSPVSKIKMANLWDFDTSFLRESQWAMIHVDPGFHFVKLLSNRNKFFNACYRQKWYSCRNKLINDVNEKIDSLDFSAINASRALNARRYGLNASTCERNRESINRLLTTRLEWLDRNIPMIATSVDDYFAVAREYYNGSVIVMKNELESGSLSLRAGETLRVESETPDTAITEIGNRITASPREDGQDVKCFKKVLTIDGSAVKVEIVLDADAIGLDDVLPQTLNSLNYDENGCVVIKGAKNGLYYKLASTDNLLDINHALESSLPVRAEGGEVRLPLGDMGGRGSRFFKLSVSDHQ